MAQYSMNTATELQIFEHLVRMNNDFVPPLSTYVDIKEYASKLYKRAVTIEYYDETNLVGLIAGYENIKENMFFISNYSVEKEFREKKISWNLFNFYLENTTFKNSFEIRLEVQKKNIKAINFYKKLGFEQILLNQNFKSCDEKDKIVIEHVILLRFRKYF